MDTTCRVARNIYIITVYVFFPKIQREARRCKKTIYKVNLEKFTSKYGEKTSVAAWEKTSERARLKKKFQ